MYGHENYADHEFLDIILSHSNDKADLINNHVIQMYDFIQDSVEDKGKFPPQFLSYFLPLIDGDRQIGNCLLRRKREAPTQKMSGLFGELTFTFVCVHLLRSRRRSHGWKIL